MAMELNVFSDRSLNSTSEWQRAIDLEGFPLRLAEEVDFVNTSGFLQARLNNKPGGFECYQDNAREAMNALGATHFDRRWRFSLGLRWRGGDLDELDSAWMAATAYAAATDGVIFDYEEGKTFTVAQARDQLRRFENERPIVDAIMKDIEKRFR